MWTTVLQVALGGAIGASMRYGVGVMSVRLLGHGFPAGTLIVNILGSFAMGVIAVIFAQKGLHHWTPLIMTGILGGFTTFSAFSLDAFTLFERGQLGTAALYIALSVTASIAALVLGVAVARGVLA